MTHPKPARREFDSTKFAKLGQAIHFLSNPALYERWRPVAGNCKATVDSFVMASRETSILWRHSDKTD
ncbi:hypothetical protein [Arthrobacter sp. 4R501]|uniref:hypothetical protein n=1 Tax=Arthrobacter sp. 4R501 TaxID=2058886 RepID=UPI000CE53578|nr:hypothetical protein [Arthrobacter sp. 4R501]